jgi:CheY-like chemotaxis protein/anti-sigma regulatory factor (Ser/Thr protein kinase)
MAVVGYTEMALANASLPESVRKELDEVLNAGYRARDLVNQILTFCRHEEQERSPVRMGVIVKEAIRFLRASLPSTIEIRQNIPSGLGSILADPTQMHQVLMNLCANAAHAMRETGGVLQIGLKDLSLDTEDVERYPGLEAGHYQALTVSDTGHGMDQTTIERIFEPFFTTKEKGEGTGMGLATVHGIVQNYGGAISVYSEPGKGTTFHLLFPKIETSGSNEHLSTTAIPGGKERILFVDDEEMLVHLGQRVLENLGYAVTAASNGMEALELFREQPGIFDLLITDQTMPKMTGANLAREVLRIRPDIPVILCTGFTELLTPEDAKGMGISEFITKPVGKRQLAETVRRVLDAE